MSSRVGGRGKVAPYATKLVRVPEPLERQVSELKSRYYGWVDAGGDADQPANWIVDTDGESNAPSRSDALLDRLESVIAKWENEIAGKDLRKNVRWSQAAKLLTDLRVALEIESEG